MLNLATRRCVATLWTVDEAKKEGDYFVEYVGINIPKKSMSFRPSSRNPEKKTILYSKKAKDGVWDVVVNAKKFSRKIFKVVSRNGG